MEQLNILKRKGKAICSPSPFLFKILYSNSYSDGYESMS